MFGWKLVHGRSVGLLAATTLQLLLLAQGSLVGFFLGRTYLAAAMGDSTGADAASRDLIGLAARAHLDGLLPRGLAILSASPTA